MVRQVSVKFNDAVSPVSFCFPEQLHKGNVYISFAETAGDMGQDTQEVAVYDDECAVLAGKVHVYMVNAADPYLPASQGFAPHRVSAPV